MTHKSFSWQRHLTKWGAGFAKTFDAARGRLTTLTTRGVTSSKYLSRARVQAADAGHLNAAQVLDRFDAAALKIKGDALPNIFNLIWADPYPKHLALTVAKRA